MKFNLSGYNISNILRSLHVKKVKIYNLKYHSLNDVEFEVEDKDIKKVKRQIANVKFKQTPRKIKNIKKYILLNLGLILGVFFGSIASIFLSNYTWQIIVYGTQELSVSEIESVLKQNGVCKGKINTQTSEEIETILLNNYDRIAQVSVIKQGSAIIINLSEKLIYNDAQYLPICATYSGVITEIDIVTGTNNVKVGDFVHAGDVLVLPYNINSNGEKVSVKPIAQIKATMFISSKCELNKTDTILQRTGRTLTEYKYKIFNKNLFSGKIKNSFALFETDVYNENVSDLLPLTRDVVTYYELTQVKIENDFEKEKQNLIDKSINLAYASLPVYEEKFNEKSEVLIINNKMFASTTITITGIIHD